MSFSSVALARLFGVLGCLLPVLATGQTLTINGDVRKVATLASTVATLTGKAELHVSDATDPIAGSIIHLDSPDAWFFTTNIPPSRVVSTFLSRLRVNGAAAALNANVRVVQYGPGAVVIPHAPDFAPLEVFDGRTFTGQSKLLRQYTYHDATSLGALKGAISSFKLKRGYMATVAQQANGTGASKVFIAQDGDLEVGVLPGDLDNQIGYVRVLPWRLVSKKGWGGGDGHQMKLSWRYDWGAEASTDDLDAEYVPMRHGPWWPGFEIINSRRNTTHLLGYNEPDNTWDPAQNPQTVEQAIAQWPELMKSGLRLGAPAPTEGGLNWLYQFIDRCDQLGYRVDFIPVHFYGPNWSAPQLQNWLRGIHERTGRPIWVTEFNNGASWNDNVYRPSEAENATRIGEFIDMMNGSSFIERYAVYNWVGDTRRMVWDGGWPLPAGNRYRDTASPLARVQEMPESGSGVESRYLFEGNTRDSTGNGLDGMQIGAPTFVAGRLGQAIVLDGATDHVQLPAGIGDSTDFTFAAWIYWSGGGEWQRIFDLGVDTNRYLYLSPKAGGNNLRFTIKNGGGEQQLNAPPLPVNQWAHVAVTIAGDTGKLFVNGVLVNTNTAMTINPVDLGTTFNFFGKSKFTADPLFAGRIDDARFLSTALTDAQVAAIVAGNFLHLTSDQWTAASATMLDPFTGSVAGAATGGTGARRFSKVGGPAWLAVASNGVLTGVPGITDGGVNRFLIRVEDSAGSLSVAEFRIAVNHAPGLVARYSFDSTPSATAGTASGTTTGAPVYTTGRRGAAIDLDGTDDFVTLPPGIASHDAITVAAWTSWDGGGNWQRLFDFGNGIDEHLFLTPKSGGNTMRFEIKSYGPVQALETTTMPVGQWTHVAVTLAGGTGHLYVNGILRDTKPIALKPSDFAPGTNFIGKSQFPDPLYNGRVDEFAIFNQALTAVQISSLMEGRAPAFASDLLNKPAGAPGQPYEQSVAANAADPDEGSTLTFSKVSGPEWLSVSSYGRISGVPSASDAGANRFVVRVTDETLLSDDATVSVAVSASSGLVAHYQLDGALANTSGGGPGVATGSPGYEASLFDMALRLDGTDDSVRLPSGIVNGLSDITIATRVKWNGGGSWQRIFDFGNGTTQYLFLSPMSGANTLRFGIVNAGVSQMLDAPALPLGEWTHIAVTLVGNTGTLYVNGAAVDTRSITHDPAALAPMNNFLGKSQYPDPLFNGSIDDFRIYNRGLSGVEVSRLAVPVAAITLPDHSFAGWAAGAALPAGQAGPHADPDRDGVANMLEYLYGLPPLVAGSSPLAEGRFLRSSELGLLENSEKTYLTLQARVRRERPGFTLVPEAAASMAELASAAAATQASQAGVPVADGEFEVITYYYDVALEDSEDGSGVIRLRFNWR